MISLDEYQGPEGGIDKKPQAMAIDSHWWGCNGELGQKNQEDRFTISETEIEKEFKDPLEALAFRKTLQEFKSGITLGGPLGKVPTAAETQLHGKGKQGKWVNPPHKPLDEYQGSQTAQNRLISFLSQSEIF